MARSVLPIKKSQLGHIETESEAIASLEYDLENQQMTCVFHKRGTYVYYDMPPDVAADWNSAGSRGIYFNLYIRNSGYQFERTS